VVKVTELMRQGIQELEDSKHRLSDDMKSMQAKFEDRIKDLISENERIKQQFLEQQALDKETIKELLAEIDMLKEHIDSHIK
jgi:hypothetical protein